MNLRDAIFTGGAALFILAAFPMLVRNAKRPPVFTSFLTSGVLFAFAVCYSSLHYQYSTVMTGTLAGIWLLTGIFTVLDKRSTAC